MGGHQSKITATETSDFIAQSTFSSITSCANSSSGGNSIDVSGDNSQANDNVQEMNLHIDESCVQSAMQNNIVQSEIANNISSAVKYKGVAALSALDGSKSDINSTIANSVKIISDQKVVENCVNKNNVRNSISVSGDGSQANRNRQRLDASIMAKCMQGSAQASTAISAITNTANQTDEHVEENPLAFIGDALKGLSSSLMAAAAILFVVVICFIFLMRSLGGGGPSADPEAPGAPAAPVMRFAPMAPAVQAAPVVRAAPVVGTTVPRA